MNGGLEPACVGEAFLEAHREQGYECPRREWADPYDGVTAELAWLGSSQDQAHLFHELIAALELTPAERRVVVRRVLHAYRDEAIAARLWPKS